MRFFMVSVMVSPVATTDEHNETQCIPYEKNVSFVWNELSSESIVRYVTGSYLHSSSTQTYIRY